MRRILLVALMALACDDSWDGPDPITYTPPGASGDGGAGLDGSAGAPRGAGGEAGSEDGGGAGGMPETADGGAGGSVAQLGGAGGVPAIAEGGAGGSVQSAWLAQCDPEACNDAVFTSCVLMSVAEGAPSEKRCTFLCDTAGGDLIDERVDQCGALGGQCRGGGAYRVSCQPTL